MKILPLCLDTMRSHEYLELFMHMMVVRMVSVANTLAAPSDANFLRGAGRAAAQQGE